jgi:hypothetical protein
MFFYTFIDAFSKAGRAVAGVRSSDSVHHNNKNGKKKESSIDRVERLSDCNSDTAPNIGYTSEDMHHYFLNDEEWEEEEGEEGEEDEGEGEEREEGEGGKGEESEG